MSAWPAVIETKELKVGWHGATVASIGELKLSPGQIVVLGGPNGVGKSTALKTIARQQKPLSGVVTISGADIHSISARDFARQVSYVPQMFEPGLELTVDELVSLGRNPHQSWWSWESNCIDRAAVDDALERTETKALRDKQLRTLSGGERQRAMIACALAQCAQFMLLDEPTAHLDFKHQLELAKLLKDLRNQGMGMLLVLHDLNLMSQLADEIILLRTNSDQPSSVASTGSPEHVLTKEVLKEVFDVQVSIVSDAASGLKVYLPVS